MCQTPGSRVSQYEYTIYARTRGVQCVSAPPNLQIFLTIRNGRVGGSCPVCEPFPCHCWVNDNQALGIKQALPIVMAEAGLGR